MNDWEIGKFLKVVIAIQLTTLGVVGLDAIGLDIPIIREFFGFIYLTFIPGILILRVLRLHKLTTIETLLYSVGLSIALLMFTGVFMNILYPFIGISEPISTWPLIITISIIVLALCGLCYKRDKDFSSPSYINIKRVLSPSALLLFLIPLLAVLGAFLVNSYQNNILLFLLIALIALIIILATFDRFIPKELYPLAIIMISLSLLFHNALISDYLLPLGDINGEYLFANMAKTNFYWDSTTPSILNSMLSLVMLSPIYSNILGMNLIWVFKIIYPLLLSILPLGLYQVFKGQTNDKTALLSVFFFMSMSIFFLSLLGNVRQQVAELFFVLLLLLMVNKRMDRGKRVALAIIFGFSLATSHYSIAYFYMFMILIVLVLMVLMGNTTIKSLLQRLPGSGKLLNKGEESNDSLNPGTTSKARMITGTYVILFITFALAWYLYTSRSAPLEVITQMGNNVFSSIYTNFFNPEARGAEVLLVFGGEAQSLQANIHRYIQIFTQFLIVVGIIRLVLRRGKTWFDQELFLMALASMPLLMMCVVLPLFATYWGASRFFQLSLLLLAPFCILGGKTVFGWLLRLLKPVKPLSFKAENRVIYTFLLTILISYFLFYTGFAYEISGKSGSSVSLSYSTWSRQITYRQDMVASRWLLENQEGFPEIYTDKYGSKFFDRFALYPGKVRWILPETVGEIGGGSYVYLRKANVAQGKTWYVKAEQSTRELKSMLLHSMRFVQFKNKIYVNGCAIYR